MLTTQITYLYDGSFEGLLTTIFEIFKHKKLPTDIKPSTNFQSELDTELITVTTTPELAARVEKSLCRIAGATVWEEITIGFLSNHADKAMIIYRYICLAIDKGPQILNYLVSDEVLTLHALKQRTKKEVDRWLGFIRFSKMDNGVYYAAFEPKDNVTPLIMPHFSERFADQPFMIHDTKRNIVGVYTLREWFLIETTAINLPDYSQDEYEYRELWKAFYRSVNIPQRRNKICQQGHLPQWYRTNMVEFL